MSKYKYKDLNLFEHLEFDNYCNSRDKHPDMLPEEYKELFKKWQLYEQLYLMRKRVDDENS